MAIKSAATNHASRSTLPARNMPNFLIIGAQKAGTTSLYHYLDQYPDVFMSPVKEPCYFAFPGERLNFRGPNNSPASINLFAVTDFEAYTDLFAGATPHHVALGEASTLYLAVPEACANIHAAVPQARIIVVLRHPVDRAWSSYLHCRRSGRESEREFSRALALEDERIAANWGFLWRYRTLGMYHAQLQPYFESFPREQILILTYDELIKQPRDMMKTVAQFIGANASFVPDMSEHHNVSGIPRSSALQMLVEGIGPVHRVASRVIPSGSKARIRKLVQRYNLTKPPIPADIRRQLQDLYDPEIDRVAELTGKDLSAWHRTT